MHYSEEASNHQAIRDAVDALPSLRRVMALTRNQVAVYGNVWEWVQGFWNLNYDGSPADSSAWLQGDKVQRVIRGGS